MKYLLLFFVLAPAFGRTQKVNPVISQDYLDFIHKNTTKTRSVQTDTINSIRSSPVLIPYRYNGFKVNRINVKNNQLELQPAKNTAIVFGGNVKMLAQIKSLNRVADLQSEYVQGRSENGSLTWKGPETDELFSYGPQHNSLEFDGSNYTYDHNGRLVPKGTGNGISSVSYNNNVLQKSFLLSRAIVLQTAYKCNYVNVVSTTLSLNKTNENTIFPNNKFSDQNGSAVVEVLTKSGIVTARYQTQTNEQINSNRNGFLSRVYQNILLTPSSFDNQQGYVLNTGQRSYSRFADNPHFLLENNSNLYHQHQKIMSVGLERKNSPFRFSLVQSFELSDQINTEIYKPGTAFFEMGMLTDRKKQEQNYQLRVNSNREFHYSNYYLRSTAMVNYVMSAGKSDIDYLHGRQYHYQRNAQDLAISFNTVYDDPNKEVGIRLENKIYHSNTTNHSDFFLPSLSAHIRSGHLFNSQIEGKLIGTISHFNSEIPLSQSFAYAGLFGFTTENAIQFLPVMEAESFKALNPIRHRELSVRAELNYRYALSLSAELFQHRVKDDVFPLLKNNQVLLQNMATHRNTGIELELNSNILKNKWSSNSVLSFSSYRSKVMNVQEGFDNAPLAGFSNIHKTIVDG